MFILGVSENMTLYFSFSGSTWVSITSDSINVLSGERISDNGKSVVIPKTTRILAITVHQSSNNYKAFILSSSTGILSNASWHCSSSSGNVWLPAVVRTDITASKPKISPKAQWIWASDKGDEKASCNKTWAGEPSFELPFLLQILYKNTRQLK